MIGMVLIKESLSELRWDLILLVFWCWLKSSWMSWPDLVLRELLRLLSISILLLVVVICGFFGCVVVVPQIVMVSMVLIYESLSELRRNLILLVLWRWFKTGRVSWPNLALSESLGRLLAVSSRSSVFIWVVDVDEIIGIPMVLPDQWLNELIWISVLLVLWCWLETSWVCWPDF
jgi:hypothetical protein